MISTSVVFITGRMHLPSPDGEVSAGIGAGVGHTKLRRSVFDPVGEQVRKQLDMQVWSSKSEISWCCTFGNYQHIYI